MRLAKKCQLQQNKDILVPNKAGYGQKIPNQQQQLWLNNQLEKILEQKYRIDETCARYDGYIKDNDLAVHLIKNPFNANRLVEMEQAAAWGLTLSGSGGGKDTEEGYELKAGLYKGLRKVDNELNGVRYYFNGISHRKTWKTQAKWTEEYLYGYAGLKLAIICPNGHLLHFSSEITDETVTILLDQAKRTYYSLNENTKDPRMDTSITTTELIGIENFILKPGTGDDFAMTYLGDTYDDVTN